MRPLETRRACLHGVRLVFDLPVGGERGVANIAVEPGAHVHGIAYRLRASEADHLDLTEGVPRGVYRRIDVELQLDDGGVLAAFTYESPHRAQGRKPSRRYLRLLLSGARHHELPQSWIEFLRSLELAVDERDPQRELF